MKREIVFDTETTGLDPRNDRVVEIGCIELINHIPTGRHFHVYLNPERAMAEDAFQIHGLSDDFLKSQPKFAEKAQEFLAFIGDAPLIAHNAGFDIGFLNAELRRIGKGRIEGVVGRIADSLQMAREMFPGKSNSLDALCKRLEVDNTGRSLHGALLDAGLLAEVYIRMTRGQESLVIDDLHGGSERGEVVAIDLAAFALPVVEAGADEIAAHEAVLDAIDKASGGRTVWRRAMA